MLAGLSGQKLNLIKLKRFEAIKSISEINHCRNSNQTKIDTNRNVIWTAANSVLERLPILTPLKLEPCLENFIKIHPGKKLL